MPVPAMRIAAQQHLNRARGGPKQLSPHLAKLKTLGLIFSQREGKEIWYDPAADRVRYERHADGRFSLTVTGRGSGVEVTVAVGDVSEE